MRRIQLCTFALGILLMTAANAQHVPQTAYRPSAEAPAWVQLMYSGEASHEAVRAAYEAYYVDHTFVKNRDTQFYKRWMRNAELPAPEVTHAYAAAHAEAANRLTGEWEELGPWSYDPEVAMQFQVQSPGACHVYTVEQSASNHEVVWCGTATAGAWKSVDHGAHWELMTRDLPLTSVYSVAIHPLDPDRVFVGSGSGQLWRTTDGGLTWEECGNSTFQGADRWYRDVIYSPVVEGEEPQLFAATNYGMFRSENDGETMIQVASSSMYSPEAT